MFTVGLTASTLNAISLTSPRRGRVVGRAGTGRSGSRSRTRRAGRCTSCQAARRRASSRCARSPSPCRRSPVSVSVGDAYQPLWIAGVSVAVVVGSFWSTLTVIELRRLDVARRCPSTRTARVCAPSPEIVNGAEYVCVGPPSTVYCVDATPEPASSVAVSVTCTGPEVPAVRAVRRRRRQGRRRRRRDRVEHLGEGPAAGHVREDDAAVDLRRGRAAHRVAGGPDDLAVPGDRRPGADLRASRPSRSSRSERTS